MTPLLDKTAVISGVILAGGKSSRMGTDKAMLKIGQYRTIERIAGVLRTLVDEILIVTNHPEKYAQYGDRTTGDIMPGNGPLGGLHAGLVRAAHPLVLVAACDLPFISAPLARLMIKCMSAEYDAVVPRYQDHFEPLCALYGKSSLRVIEQRLSLGLNKTIRLFDELRIRYLEEEEMLPVEPCLEKVFFNVNTPDDLKKAQTWCVADNEIRAKES